MGVVLQGVEQQARRALHSQVHVARPLVRHQHLPRRTPSEPSPSKDPDVPPMPHHMHAEGTSKAAQGTLNALWARVDAGGEDRKDALLTYYCTN